MKTGETAATPPPQKQASTGAAAGKSEKTPDAAADKPKAAQSAAPAKPAARDAQQTGAAATAKAADKAPSASQQPQAADKTAQTSKTAPPRSTAHDGQEGGKTAAGAGAAAAAQSSRQTDANSRSLLHAGLGAVAGGIIVLLGGQLLSNGSESGIAKFSDDLATAQADASSAQTTAATALEQVGDHERRRAELEQDLEALRTEIAKASTELEGVQQAIRTASEQPDADGQGVAVALQIEQLRAEFARELDAVRASTAAAAKAARSEGDGAQIEILEEALEKALTDHDLRIAELEAQGAAATEAAALQTAETPVATDDAGASSAAPEAAGVSVVSSARATPQAVAAEFAGIALLLSGETPFPEAIARLEAASSIPVPAALRAAAETGLSTRAELAARFDDASRDALMAIAQEDAKLGGFLDRIGALVVVRSTVESVGFDPDATLSRAKARIDKGDVAGAVALVRGLAGPPPHLRARASALFWPARCASPRRTARAPHSRR